MIHQVNRHPRVIMFDLENTIISTWSNEAPLPHKIEKIYEYIRLQDLLLSAGVDVFYGIFSFAVDHEGEKEKAKRIALNALNDKNIVFDDRFITSFNDLEKILNTRVNTDSLQKWEIINVYSKDKMFPIYCDQFPNFDFILFDDALEFQMQHIVRRKEYRQTPQVIDMIRV